MGDISGIFQILALGGFLAMFGGVGLVVVAASQGRQVRGGVLLAVAGLVAGVSLLVVSQGLLVVAPTQRAVVFNVLSGDLERPRESGVNIIIPGIQTPFLYPISQQNYTMSDTQGEGDRIGGDAVEARSIDGQQVRIDLTLIFQIRNDAEALNQIHRDWFDQPGGYREGLIRPALRSIVRDVVATFEAEAIYGVGREDMQDEIERRVTESFDTFGLQVTDLLIRNVNFTDQFTDAIERKQIEEQELERARTEAQRVEAEATGRANAAIEEARGEAEAVLIRARADAEALRLVSEQIAANPNLIQYTYVQNLSDNVGLALVPSNTPFLFDANMFQNLGEGFTAPDVPEDVDVGNILPGAGDNSPSDDNNNNDN